MQDEVDNLTCGICRDIFNNPYSLNQCQHTFCYTCLSHTIATKKCAICKETTLSWNRNRIIEKTVDFFMQKNPSLKKSEQELESLVEEREKIKILELENVEFKDSDSDSDLDRLDYQDSDNTYFANWMQKYDTILETQKYKEETDGIFRKYHIRVGMKIKVKESTKSLKFTIGKEGIIKKIILRKIGRVIPRILPTMIVVDFDCEETCQKIKDLHENREMMYKRMTRLKEYEAHHDDVYLVFKKGELSFSSLENNKNDDDDFQSNKRVKTQKSFT